VKNLSIVWMYGGANMRIPLREQDLRSQDQLAVAPVPLIWQTFFLDRGRERAKPSMSYAAGWTSDKTPKGGSIHCRRCCRVVYADTEHQVEGSR
jgi:hypothetical protein